MRKIQLTIELPDDFDSIEQLEGIINAQGQQIKQQLFEGEFQRLIDKEKQATQTPIVCPHCKKKEPSFEATSPDA